MKHTNFDYYRIGILHLTISWSVYHATTQTIASPLASLHEKQRTQIHDMLPEHCYNETFILLTRDFS